MRRFPWLALALVACGGSDAIDPAFAGTWNGTTLVSISGFAPVSYASSVTISVNGGAARIANACPVGVGSVTATGSGEFITWRGSLACSPVSFPDCASVLFTLLSGSLTLNGGTLSGSVAANGEGCGVTRAATFAFQGSR